jgi:protein-S-isoprenylcysteine O-methyltransferase Ste14
VLLLYAGFLLKSRIEEIYMGDTFGAQYEEYRRDTGALIPRLHF